MTDIIRQMAISGRVLPVVEHGSVIIAPGGRQTVIDFEVPPDYAFSIPVFSQSDFIRIDLFINDRLVLESMPDFTLFFLNWWFPPTYVIRIDSVNPSASPRRSNVFFFGNLYPLLDFDLEIERMLQTPDRMAA